MTMAYSDKRRRFLGAAAATAAAFAGPTSMALATGARRNKQAQRDLALVNGRIHTFDKHDTVVDSLLIKDGRFAKVGGVRDTGEADVVNLRGRTVIPGIIDNHVHFIRIGNAAGYDERRLEIAFSVGQPSRSSRHARNRRPRASSSPRSPASRAGSSPKGGLRPSPSSTMRRPGIPC